MGAGGPIVSAELVSDEPQTVAYTVDPRFVWSNGESFSIADLEQRIDAGQSSSESWADGFHHIARTKVTNHAKTLRVVFGTHYASWANMFQGLEFHSTAPVCSLGTVSERPSLGPYLLESLNSHRAVLVANPQFRVRSQQFRTVVIEAGASAGSTQGRTVVDYRTDPSPTDLTWMASLPGRSGKISMSQNLLSLTFSSGSAAMRAPEIRTALSFAVDRWSILNTAIGDITQYTAPAASALLTQGQSGYPGVIAVAPYQVAGTTLEKVPTPPYVGSHESDCPVCARDALAQFLHVSAGDITSSQFRGNLRLGVVSGRLPIQVAEAVSRSWRELGFRTRIVTIATEVELSQALTEGQVDAGVTTPISGNAGRVGATWSGSRRRGSTDYGWRSTVCNQVAIAAESDFNATTATQKWLTCDREIAEKFWQRPLFAIPYSLQWTNTVLGVAPSNTLAGFIDQIPQWSSLQSAG